MSGENEELLRKMHKVYPPRVTPHTEEVIRGFTGRKTALPSQILKIVHPSPAVSEAGYPPTEKDIEEKGDDAD